MKQLNANILENNKIAPDIYRMRIESPYLAKNSKPGQFVEVRCSEGLDPLLRRPLGVHRILKGGIELLYEVVGKGTELLSRKKNGELLDIIGPLGNGFEYKSTVHSPQSTILVAGGIGVAPLVALAEEIVHRPQSIVHRKKKRLCALIGAKTKLHILCESEFRSLGYSVKVATEDGSKGHKGLVTGLLQDLLSTVDSRLWTIYACGPTAMLKAVWDIAKAKRIPCQFSFEERMACGVGVCLGCPIKVRGLTGSRVNGLKPDNPTTRQPANSIYKMVCKDGPVFDAAEVIW